jgi:hypothetical protein
MKTMKMMMMTCPHPHRLNKVSPALCSSQSADIREIPSRFATGQTPSLIPDGIRKLSQSEFQQGRFLLSTLKSTSKERKSPSLVIKSV